MLIMVYERSKKIEATYAEQNSHNTSQYYHSHKYEITMVWNLEKKKNIPCTKPALSFVKPSVELFSSNDGTFGCSQNTGCGKPSGKTYGGWKHTVPWGGGIAGDSVGKNGSACDGSDGISDNWWSTIVSSGSGWENIVVIFVLYKLKA